MPFVALVAKNKSVITSQFERGPLPLPLVFVLGYQREASGGAVQKNDTTGLHIAHRGSKEEENGSCQL